MNLPRQRNACLRVCNNNISFHAHLAQHCAAQMYQDLLEFTRCLDFDKYIRDAEVQAMINQVKRRIAEIEAQPEVDGVDDDDMEHSDWRGRLRLHDVEARLEVSHHLLAGLNVFSLIFLGSLGLATPILPIVFVGVL